MGKVMYILAFLFSMIFGSVVLMLSVGWFLALFGILLLPVIIFHIVAGIVAINRHPMLTKWSLWSWIAYLVFTLFRPDLDDVSNYSGYSILLHNLGVIDDKYIESDTFHFIIAVAALLIMIVLDILIVRKARRKRNQPPLHDYV